jgi:hypothetical protein
MTFPEGVTCLSNSLLKSGLDHNSFGIQTGIQKLSAEGFFGGQLSVGNFFKFFIART